MTRRWQDNRTLAAAVWATFALTALALVSWRNAESFGLTRFLAIAAVVLAAVTVAIWWRSVVLPRRADRHWATRKAAYGEATRRKRRVRR